MYEASGGLKFWTCFHATVLLTIKYSAELNKYILLVMVICENTGFKDSQISPQPVFFANNPH